MDAQACEKRSSEKKKKDKGWVIYWQKKESLPHNCTSLEGLSWTRGEGMSRVGLWGREVTFYLGNHSGSQVNP